MSDSLTEHALTEDITAHMRDGLRVGGLVILTVIHFGLALPKMLSHLPTYPHAWVALAVFGLLTLVIAVDVFLELTGRRRPRWWSTAALVGTLAGSVAATSQVPAEYYMGAYHWTFLEIGWFGVLFLHRRGLPATLAFLGTHLCLTLLQLLLAGFPSRTDAVGMCVSALVICTFQVSAAILARLVRNCATAASAATHEQERVRTQAAIGAQVHADHQARYQALRAAVIPLLTGLADGSLSPEDEETRRRCSLEAARLRRLLAESDQASDPLVHELRAGVAVAERHGVDVQLAVLGAPVAVPRDVRRALTEPILAALTAAQRTARATVVRRDGTVRLSVVIDAPASEIPLPARRDARVRVRTLHGEGRLWVEAACDRQSSSNEISPS
ncbi:hypothetical protein SAMN06297387_10213 [Streptomyces zhaozhouensis]|uniref:Signal transduction histidine kinase n=1 Tax=Streptomyces zhaozhouensis TaxID=1300267 RepID=A0A286DMX6_9ACTN|nr:cytochrome C oxidase subunit IV family protein [Streptomyces zhaozhouensis]SOD60097.1 hypothetical protein SAMN06297387_10213 [Streptomyces zhaozhouensis]